MGIVDFPTDGNFKRNYGSSVLCNDKKKLPADTIVFM